MTTNPYRYALIGTIKLVDLLVITLALGLAAVTELHPQPWTDVLRFRVEVRNVFLLAGFLAYCHVVLRSLGLYRSHRLTSCSQEAANLAWVTMAVTVGLYGVGAGLDLELATPGFAGAFACFAFFGLVLERRGFRALARAVRRHGHNLRNVLVVGRDEGGLELAARLMRRTDLGYAVESVVDAGAGGDAAALEQVTRLLETRPIDEVFITLPLDAHQGLIRNVVGICEEQGVTVRLLSSLVDLVLARAQVDEIDGRPVISIFSGPPDSPMLAVKRLMDVTVSALILAGLTPLLALVAGLIKLDSSGPVFFVQERVGLGGRRFKFYKLRTMVKDAERLQPTLEGMNEASGAIFKIKRDPRITRVGRVLRQLSIDELPQLWNVLRGDMSLVGPRPLPVRDVQRIDQRAHKRRFSVKPGITCLWQVDGRTPSFEDWVRTDMEYIDNWSLGLDLKILMKTIPAVLSGRGAW